MENHIGRPEVVEALQRGDGSATRYSTTVRHEMLYHAFYEKSAGEGRIVRVAKPLKEVESAIESIRWSILTGLFARLGLGTGAGLVFFPPPVAPFSAFGAIYRSGRPGIFPAEFFPRAHP